MNCMRPRGTSSPNSSEFGDDFSFAGLNLSSYELILVQEIFNFKYQDNFSSYKIRIHLSLLTF